MDHLEGVYSFMNTGYRETSVGINESKVSLVNETL